MLRAGLRYIRTLISA